MTYEELKKAYEESLQKCSELEKEIEDKDLRIRMGQAAVKSSQRYRADVIMPKWQALFERLKK